MSDLTDFRDHARTMAISNHKPECLTRPLPWAKPQPTRGCKGCVSDADRALWARLADEVDHYLADAEQDDLFGGAT